MIFNSDYVGINISKTDCKSAFEVFVQGGMLESIANGGSFLEGFEDGALSGAISGAIGGAAFAGLGQLGAVAGKGIKCMSGFGKFIKGTASVTKVMSTAMGGFDTIALVDKAFGNGDIATLNAKLHESKAYNIFQTGVTATAVFTGGMTTTMKCFVAGTLVLTASGLVAIENIKPGDMVYAADAETLEVSTKHVLETYIRETSSLVHLTINGENIISTYDHPYYVKDKGFVSAESLWIGAELIDKNGDILYVEQIYREKLDNQFKTVYNFKVEDYHTYFVGDSSLLVHNAEYSPTKPRYGERRISDEEYDELRSQTPSRKVRQKVNENNIIGADDPAIPGKKIEGSLEADHIVSMDKITKMENFDKLSTENKLKVLNYEDNFTGLSKSANASKGAKSYSEWTLYKKENIPISQEYRTKMMVKESILEPILQGMIDELAGK